VIQSHRGGGYRRCIAHVDVNGARFWIEDHGDGPAVLFLHGGLGDVRLFEPQAAALSDAFRCVSYDRRFWGRTEAPAEPFASVDDALGILDALGIERAALVGLSAGGGLALDIAYSHPDRTWALVHVAGGVTGMPVGLGDDLERRYEEAEARGDVDAMMDVDFEVWAPLGVEDLYRELWLTTPDARGLPDGAAPAPRADVVLEDVHVPTLVVIAKHDPPELQAVEREATRRIPDAQLVEIDSDHYLTLREPERVTKLIRDFLTPFAPQQ
jgi:3-oxoadipate enol-lactonase